MNKTYNEVKKRNSFNARFNYLKLKGKVGRSTFGGNRYMNQRLYKSKKWLDARDRVIIRDKGCDLGIQGLEIQGMIIVHHINPITIEDVYNDSDCVYDSNNLVCTSLDTHNALHFEGKCPEYEPVERLPNDTVPWKN